MFGRLLTPPSYLARLQRKHPPRRGDRALQIYNAFASRLPGGLTEVVRQQSIAVGTVDRDNPDVYTVHVRGGSVVVFHRSMMDFVYAVTKSLIGLVVGRTAAGIEYQQALGIGDVKDLVAALFLQWRTHQEGSSAAAQIRYPGFQLAEEAHRLAEHLATAVDMFMLCHEMAHAMLERTGQSNTETDADRLGLEYFVPSAAEPQMRLPLAGAFLAIRILAGLERVGVQFSTDYPPQQERVNQLLEAWRLKCPSALYFDETMIIAVSFLEQMDDVDDLIEGGPRGGHNDVYRNYIRLLAQLEEVARGRLLEQELLDGMKEVVGLVGPERMRKVAQRLKTSCPPIPSEEPSFLEMPLRLVMGATLLQIQSKLSAELQRAFR